MKHWQLTAACVKPMKEVLEAIERTQLSSCCVEQSLYEIEKALEDFLDNLKEISEEHYLEKDLLQKEKARECRCLQGN